MDITRNVCVREVFSETAAATVLPPETAFDNSTHNQIAKGDAITGSDATNKPVLSVNMNDLTSSAISKHRNSLPNVALPNLLHNDDVIRNGEAFVAQQNEVCSEVDNQKCITTNPVITSASLHFAAELKREVQTVNFNKKNEGAQDEGCISGR